MIIKSKTINKGFFIAGLMNGSVLVFSKLFTNPAIAKFDPNVMSNFGLLMIVLWGLAYASVATTYQHVKWLVAVFAIEKLIYGVNWIMWLLKNSLANVYNQDLFAGLFYSVYGLNDWVFFIFFSTVFYRLNKTD